MKRVTVILLAAWVVPLACCSERLTLREVGKATEVRLRDMHASDQFKVLRVITDPQQVQKIVSAVDSERQGWGASLISSVSPAPSLMLEFYDGDRFLRAFGVGRRFFWTESPRGSIAKSMSDSQVQRFLDLVGMDSKVLGPE